MSRRTMSQLQRTWPRIQRLLCLLSHESINRSQCQNAGDVELVAIHIEIVRKGDVKPAENPPTVAMSVARAYSLAVPGTNKVPLRSPPVLRTM